MHLWTMEIDDYFIVIMIIIIGFEKNPLDDLFLFADN